MSGFIPDGYTERGFINEQPGLHPKVTFAWRPITNEEYADFLGLVDGKSPAQEVKHQAAALAAHLVDWDLADAKGSPAPISAQTILRNLGRLLSTRLWRIVAGFDAPDGYLGKSDEEAKRYAGQEQQAKDAGQTVRELRETAETKN